MVLALVALSLIAALSTVLTALIIFPDGTPDLDEVAYQSQANALSDGHMRLSAATHDPFFRPFLRASATTTSCSSTSRCGRR